jgi:transcriptional regulator with XRE-family HTH domain
MSINSRINQVRLALELTQSKFAERIAVSASYLAGMERGDKKVNDRVIRLVSMEFGISEHWIRTGEGEMYDDNEKMNAAKLLSVFNSLSPEYQQGALAMLDVLADLQKHNVPTY